MAANNEPRYFTDYLTWQRKTGKVKQGPKRTCDGILNASVDPLVRSSSTGVVSRISRYGMIDDVDLSKTQLKAIELATNMSDCTCGYSVNINSSTNSSQSYAIFTELLETDFTHTTQIHYPLNPCWRPQEYEISPSWAHGTYGKSANLSNVVPNPFSSWNNWVNTSGIYGSEAPGLQLWVGATPIHIWHIRESYEVITMGEIMSNRSDILYGSFRVAMQVTGTPGTCGAFFWVCLYYETV